MLVFGVDVWMFCLCAIIVGVLSFIVAGLLFDTFKGKGKRGEAVSVNGASEKNVG